MLDEALVSGLGIRGEEEEKRSAQEGRSLKDTLRKQGSGRKKGRKGTITRSYITDSESGKNETY